MKLFVARHAYSLGNLANHTGKPPVRDPRLSEYGLETASRFAWEHRTTFDQIDVVYCSPLKRTIQTAQILCPNLPIRVSPFLREIPNVIDNEISPLSRLKREFPRVDFSRMEGVICGPGDMNAFYKSLEPEDKDTVLAVTHCDLMTASFGPEDFTRRPHNLCTIEVPCKRSRGHWVPDRTDDIYDYRDPNQVWSIGDIPPHYR